MTINAGMLMPNIGYPRLTGIKYRIGPECRCRFPGPAAPLLPAMIEVLP